MTNHPPTQATSSRRREALMMRQVSLNTGCAVRWLQFKNIMKRPLEVLKKLAPIIILFSFTVIGATIMLFTERAHGQVDDFFVKNFSQCIAAGDYWAAVIYVNGLSTADKIGGVTTCTTVGKFITVCFTLFSLPLAIIVLNQVGDFVSSTLHHVLVNYKKKLKYLQSPEKRYEKVKNSAADADELMDVPTSLGIGITVGWIMFCAAVFSIWNNWPYGESLYFTFTMLTLGVLVDISSYGWKQTVFTMTALFFGLAFISNTINIIQANLERLVKRVEIKVQEEIKEALENSAGGESGETPDQIVQRVLKDLNAPPWMVSMIPQTKFERLTEKAEKLNTTVSAETQTDRTFRETADASTQDDELDALPFVLQFRGEKPVHNEATSHTQKINCQTICASGYLPIRPRISTSDIPVDVAVPSESKFSGIHIPISNQCPVSTVAYFRRSFGMFRCDITETVTATHQNRKAVYSHNLCNTVKTDPTLTNSLHHENFPQLANIAADVHHIRARPRRKQSAVQTFAPQMTDSGFGDDELIAQADPLCLRHFQQFEYASTTIKTQDICLQQPVVTLLIRLKLFDNDSQTIIKEYADVECDARPLRIFGNKNRKIIGYKQYQFDKIIQASPKTDEIAVGCIPSRDDVECQHDHSMNQILEWTKSAESQCDFGPLNPAPLNRLLEQEPESRRSSISSSNSSLGMGLSNPLTASPVSSRSSASDYRRRSSGARDTRSSYRKYL